MANITRALFIGNNFTSRVHLTSDLRPCGG